MQQTNLPSNSSASPNLQTSLQVSVQQLQQALAQFGDEYTSLVFNKYQRPPASIIQAVESPAPSFRNVTDFFSREATLMWLRYHIAETFAFLGIYDTASKRQVRQTAELILDHEIFGQLNLDEFLQFLKQFKRGDYGKIYQSARPNPQEFLLCLRPFWNELVEHRVSVSRREEDARLAAKEASDRANAISWEEYCRQTGRNPSDSPLNRLLSKS